MHWYKLEAKTKTNELLKIYIDILYQKKVLSNKTRRKQLINNIKKGIWEKRTNKMEVYKFHIILDNCTVKLYHILSNQIISI